MIIRYLCDHEEPWKTLRELTYRAMHSAFQVKVSCYFIELYLDNLRDLLFAMDHPTGTPPRLEIHMDSNKMVVVKNVVVKVGGHFSLIH